MKHLSILRSCMACVIGMGLAHGFLHGAELNVIQRSTVDQEGLVFANGDQTRFGNFPNGVTHQQFPIQTYRGHQYAVYYDGDRQVCVGRRKLPEGPWEVVRFTDYNITNSDTHNVAVLGICENDGTIHLTWDHHVSDLHYRRSLVGVANDPDAFAWEASLFGPVTDTLGPLGKITQVTYPRFVSMPDGNLMLYYRFVTSGNGDSVIRVYDGNTSQWTTSRGKFIDRQIGSYSFGGETSQYRYAYINGIGYGGDRLHCSWVWRDRFDKTDVNNQHDLCYAYSDDDGVTWRNSAGTQIAVTGSSFIHIDSPGLIVFPAEPGRGMANQNGQFAYPDGGIHVIQPRYREGESGPRYFHHHWRDAAGNWHWQDLGYQGSRPEVVGDDERNLFIIYTAGDNLRIAKGVPNFGWTAWSWSLIYNSDSPVTTGGDGQIDLSRWYSERVLSVYGQEEPVSFPDYGSGTMIDAPPTPLNVTDFQVSLQAARPAPSHEALDVPLDGTLSWTAGINAVSHRIFFGTDGAAVAAATTASPEYKGQQSGTNFTPDGPLAGGTEYYWRIDEVETGGVVRTGLLWSFTVAEAQLPTISPLPDQSTAINTATSELAFTVSGAADLVVSGESSNPLLIPDANIVFGGSGTDRTVLVTPAADQSGFADITVTVSDSLGTAASTFRVRVVIPGAPVAHWPLDEGSGSVAGDASGNGHTGTLLNGASWASDGTRGSFVSFDGDDDRIITPFAYALSAGEDLTWSWWANQQSTGNEDAKAVMIGNRYPTPGAGGENLEFIKFTPTGGEFANTGLAENVEKHIYDTILPGGWHHYAMTKTGTSYQWYVDGVAHGSPVTIGYDEDTPIPLFIGGDDNGTGKPTEHFHGSIDDVVLYDRALTAFDVANLMVGIHEPIVTLSTLGQPVDSTDSAVWSDGLAAHPGARYSVPSTGNLRSPNGSSTFPGNSLTIHAGGKFQVRAIEASADVTTVDQLFLNGGASFAAGEFAELTAGTGNGTTNVLDGNLTNSGHGRFTTYGVASGNTVARNLRVLSLIGGTGRIQARESSAQSLSSVFIDNPNNTYSGIWESAAGSNLVFSHAGAIGPADIEVMTGGSLEILGDWSASSVLTVADAAGTTVKLGTHSWTVASLHLGITLLPDGIYLSSQLNSLGGATFTGSGLITVGSPSEQQKWRFSHFGTTENTGNAADSFDANSDGENNLLEFATGQDPHAGTLARTEVEMDGGNLEFRYTRGTAAVADGMTFTVEWSETMATGEWSTTGVTEVTDPENSGDSEVENRIATVPAGVEGKRFIRLRVVRP